jgi:hypothetical protein
MRNFRQIINNKVTTGIYTTKASVYFQKTPEIPGNGRNWREKGSFTCAASLHRTFFTKMVEKW